MLFSKIVLEGVDDVLRVALRDGAHGAAVHTGAAADASVTDNIGHDMYTSIKMVLSILAHFFKKAMLNFWSFKFFAPARRRAIAAGLNS